ncbi:alpha/beta hydrolase fold domain-containing protein [Streptomyces rochei]|uniref:alpha/beta hydrolase fold domain-containing protein n=1 Tax=Streptomyces rochei TaxID=1928 RepID=UPI0036BAAD23
MPKGVRPVGELLYTHGGAYVHPLVTAHWHIIGNLGLTTMLRVTVPLYALAPEQTGDETYPKLHKLYDSLTESGLPLITAGDSAGGALAMALTIRARDEHRPLPGAVLLFSPYADATLTHPDIPVIEPRDPMLGSEGLRWAVRRWAGDRPLEHPWLSPVNDNLRALPRISVFHGERDILCPDAKKMVAKAKAAGPEINLYPDVFHVFVGLPQLPESRAALAHAGSRLPLKSTPVPVDGAPRRGAISPRIAKSGPRSSLAGALYYSVVLCSSTRYHVVPAQD